MTLSTKIVFALIVVAAATVGCSRPAITTTGCTVSSDCGDNQQCDTVSGQCLCLDDSACDPSEFCNAVGKCQTVLECLDNSDCIDSELCDTTTGSCLASVPGICVLDSQCPFGSYCGANRGCSPGCRDNGDCPLGTPCLDGQCDDTPGACNNNSFCDYGDLCVGNRCVAHADKSQRCDDCASDPTSCFDNCLIDSSVAASACTSDSDCDRGSCERATCAEDTDCPNGGSCNFFGLCSTSVCRGAFCGSSGCSESNPCPRGYACNTLIAVSGTPCTIGGAADQCGANRACLGGGENEVVGFCSCASDGDCPIGTACENPGVNGLCITGTTCAPADGLLCEDLR
jgi:hypothetical protein